MCSDIRVAVVMAEVIQKKLQAELEKYQQLQKGMSMLAALLF